VSLSAKLKKLNRIELASIAFYAVSGILLLASLPLSSYAPHLGFIGILSLIAAFSLFMKRGWAPWLVAVLLIINSVFSLYTLLSIGFSNVLVALAMIGVLVLTWAASIYLLVIKRRS
jgi:hypothetical protein